MGMAIATVIVMVMAMAMAMAIVMAMVIPPSPPPLHPPPALRVACRLRSCAARAMRGPEEREGGRGRGVDEGGEGRI